MGKKIKFKVDMIDFQEIVDKVDELPIDSQLILFDLMKKRITENQRELFINETIDSYNQYKNNDYTEGNSEDLFRELNI